MAFHCDRRERVLERDIFRFGTATSVLLRGGVLAGGARRGSGRFGCAGTRAAELLGEGGPARVDDLPADHTHEVADPRWAALAQKFTTSSSGTPGETPTPEEN